MAHLRKTALIIFVLSMFYTSSVFAVDPALQAKIDSKITEISSWGKDPELVAAVKDLSENPTETTKTMTQEEWEGLTIIAPKIREFTGNKVSAFLKSKKSPWVSEAFVSSSKGTKLGFLSKPTSWSHAGKPKHEKPLAGSTWQGELELDKSAGKEQVQISVPVLENDKPIASLVVGLDIGAI